MILTDAWVKITKFQPQFLTATPPPSHPIYFKRKCVFFRQQTTILALPSTLWEEDWVHTIRTFWVSCRCFLSIFPCCKTYCGTLPACVCFVRRLLYSSRQVCQVSRRQCASLTPMSCGKHYPCKKKRILLVKFSSHLARWVLLLISRSDISNMENDDTFIRSSMDDRFCQCTTSNDSKWSSLRVLRAWGALAPSEHLQSIFHRSWTEWKCVLKRNRMYR